MWLIVSSLSPHILHNCFVASYLFSLWLSLMALSCAAIRRDSVSLLRFPFPSHVQVFWSEMLFISRLKWPLSCFFLPFLFPSYCLSIIYRVVRIVSDGCNQSPFVFFYVVFEPLYGCINGVFDADKSSSSLFIIIIIIIYSLEFSHQRKLMVFHWRLSDNKSPQGCRTLLSILAVFNNAVFGKSPLVRQLPNLPGPLIILYLPCQRHQSQLV